MSFENYPTAMPLFPARSRVLCPSPARQALHRLQRGAAAARPPLDSSAALPAPTGEVRRDLCSSRCCQKACVFPAHPDGRGECIYHCRQSLEPDRFQSLQPSSLLLDQAKFGLPDSEPDDTRVQDRHRLATERVQFILGEAA